MLRDLSGIVNSIVKYGTGGCAGRSVSSGFLGHESCAGVFPIIFVLQLKHLPCTGPTLEKRAGSDTLKRTLFKI